jgi:hypothetical protein
MFYTVSGNVLDTDCSIICAPFSSSGIPEGAVSSELMNDKRFCHEIEGCFFSDKWIGRCFVLKSGSEAGIAVLITNDIHFEQRCSVLIHFLSKAIKEMLLIANLHCFSVAIPYKMGCEDMQDVDWNIFLKKFEEYMESYPKVTVKVYK